MRFRSVVYSFALCAVFSAGHFVLAQSQCRAIDLRPALGAVRDQGDSSWCFAHTTADLISAKLGVRVSSFDLATTFLLADERVLSKNKSAAVSEYLTLHPEFQDRLHLERTRDPKVYGSAKILTEKGLFDAGGVEDITVLLSNVNGTCLESELSDDDDAQTIYDDNLVSIARSLAALPAPEKVKWEKRMRRLPHLTSARARAKAGAFQAWVNQRCRKRVYSPEPLIPGQFYIADSPEDLDRLNLPVRKARQVLLKSIIDAELELHHALAIGFDANDLIDRDPDDHQKHADHSAVIAARGADCRYLIRFTWGDECDFFAKKFQSRCEHGGVWVDLEEIPTLYSAVWIE